jgi:hypothetical protein
MTPKYFSRDEFGAYIDDHRAILDAPNQHNPFATSAWTKHWVSTVAAPGSRFVALESDTGKAMMLLKVDDPAGRHLSALTNYYASQYSAAITTVGDGRDAAEQLADCLTRARGPHATVTLAPLYRAAPEFEGTRAGLSRHGWITTSYDVSGNWHLPCDGMTFADYMAGRPSELRNTWQRKSKKFNSTKGARTEIIATAGDAMDRAIAAYQAVYPKSWKQPEPYPEFVPGWARICAERGWARLGVAWLEDEPIAAQFWFVFDRRAYIFKLAYSEAHAKMSAGTVLNAELMRYVLEIDRVVEVDFGTGDDTYKQSWMSHRRERVGIRAMNLASLPGLGEAARTFGGALRRKIQALSRRPQGASQDVAPASGQ